MTRMIKEEKKTGEIPASKAQAIVIGHLFSTFSHHLKHASQMFEKIGNGETISYEDLLQDEPRVRAKKRMRDPAAPPKAKTAYMLFCDDRRPLLKEKNIPFPQQSKMLADEWKNLPLSTKQKYSEKASKDKSRFDLAMKDYGNSQPSTPAPIPDDSEEEEESPSKRRKTSHSDDDDDDEEVKESDEEESPSPKDKKSKPKEKPKKDEKKEKEKEKEKEKPKSKEKPKMKEEKKEDPPKKKEASSQEKKETPKGKKN